MFTRIATVFTFLFFVLPFLASATAIEARGGGGGGGGSVSQCNTGSIQCCDSVQSASSNVVTELLGTLGLAVGSITGQVGLTCNPISVIGAGGNSCSAQPVCCTGNSFGGGGILGLPSLLVVGCSPININV